MAVEPAGHLCLPGGPSSSVTLYLWGGKRIAWNGRRLQNHRTICKGIWKAGRKSLHIKG